MVYVLTTFVPAFHTGLPDEVYALINWLVPVAVGVVSAYLAKHTARPDLRNETPPAGHMAG